MRQQRNILPAGIILKEKETFLTQDSIWCSILQVATYMVVEKGMEHKGEQRKIKISFGTNMMQALDLLQLAKRNISRRSNIEQ